jgi:hypothetical protein
MAVEIGLTWSASPQRMCRTRPRGTTCAMSPRRTVSLPEPSFPATPRETFNPSTISGLRRPPLRSWESSWVSFSMARRTEASRLERSKASSVAVGRLAEEAELGGVESVRAWALLALPAFLWRVGEVVKARDDLGKKIGV